MDRTKDSFLDLVTECVLCLIMSFSLYHYISLYYNSRRQSARFIVLVKTIKGVSAHCICFSGKHTHNISTHIYAESFFFFVVTLE